MVIANEETGEFGEYEVIDTISHTDEDIIHLYLDGELIETTAEHPFYTDDGAWVNAADLSIGEQILSLDGDYGTVELVIVVEDVYQPMYNLTVEDVHNFAVGDGEWVVHNQDDVRNPLTKPINAMEYNVSRATKNNYKSILSRYWERPANNWDAHHIVAWNHHRAAPGREILDKVGIGYHQPANMVWLPSNKSILQKLKSFFSPRSHHGSGIHSYANIDDVNKRMARAYTNAGGDAVSTRSTRQAVLHELYNIANEYLRNC